MAIIRCCSYEVGIKTPVNPSTYSKILVTFSQDGQEVIVKEKTDLTLLSDGVKVKLSQTETAQFNAPGVAMLQLRAYTSLYNAPGSRMWAIDVYPTNNERILS